WPKRSWTGSNRSSPERFGTSWLRPCWNRTSSASPGRSITRSTAERPCWDFPVRSSKRTVPRTRKRSFTPSARPACSSNGGLSRGSPRIYIESRGAEQLETGGDHRDRFISAGEGLDQQGFGNHGRYDR